MEEKRRDIGRDIKTRPDKTKESQTRQDQTRPAQHNPPQDKTEDNTGHDCKITVAISPRLREY
jgi:hypothetical protein